ncbi:MAG TPA: BACON domain-containing protein, partial [Vicinamibacterales bacterium]
MLTIVASACGSSSTTSVTTTAPTTTRCQATLSSSASSFDANGGTANVTVSVARECAWTATSQVPWIQITAGSSGQGDGTVTFKVAANADPVTRQGSLGVADQTTTIAQAAGACQFNLAAPTTQIAAAGGQTSLGVSTNALCVWTASTNAPWATVSPATGKGSASITVTADSNSGPERTATVSIGQAQAALRQASAPQAPPS